MKKEIQFTVKSRLSQVERLVYFKFHASLHVPLFHCHVTLGKSEKSGDEVHSVGMATEAVVGTPLDLNGFVSAIVVYSFWATSSYMPFDAIGETVSELKKTKYLIIVKI